MEEEREREEERGKKEEKNYSERAISSCRCAQQKLFESSGILLMTSRYLGIGVKVAETEVFLRRWKYPLPSLATRTDLMAVELCGLRCLLMV